MFKNCQNCMKHGCFICQRSNCRPRKYTVTLTDNSTHDFYQFYFMKVFMNQNPGSTYVVTDL